MKQKGSIHTFPLIGSMDDDPDDLAAAFFAQQAAKEAKKTALPTKDWIRVIQETTNNNIGAADAEKRLAITSLPDAQVESDDTMGIILNSENCSLEKKNDSVKDDDHNNEMNLMRDKIKELMMQKMESNLQKLDDR